VGGLTKTMECREQDSRPSIGVVVVVDVGCGGGEGEEWKGVTLMLYIRPMSFNAHGCRARATVCLECEWPGDSDMLRACTHCLTSREP
jgi:hypothetical protein